MGKQANALAVEGVNARIEPSGILVIDLSPRAQRLQFFHVALPFSYSPAFAGICPADRYFLFVAEHLLRRGESVELEHVGAA